jgi:HlyD family secretion protein
VVSPGTILMTLVPSTEALRAEVWVRNDDIGFVRPGQAARVKLSAFQFQKYGMLAGQVAQVGVDAGEDTQPGGRDESAPGLLYRALVHLDTPYLEVDGQRHTLAAGMQVAAEIRLGERTVLEYLLSPVGRAFQEAGRER